MDKKAIISLILVIVVISAALVYYESNRIRQESMAHSYRYTVQIESTGPVHNPVIIVPIGSVNGPSLIVDAIESGQMTGVPDDWNLTVIPTLDGIFLKISAPRIIASTPVTPLAADEESDQTDVPVNRPTPVVLGVRVDSESAVETISPEGTEPVLGPRTSTTQVPCTSPHPDNMPVTCYTYTVPVYADFGASNHTRLSIQIEMEGENTWWLGGWSGNSYHDRVHFTVIGPFSGWTTGEGTSVYGLGRY